MLIGVTLKTLTIVDDCRLIPNPNTFWRVSEEASSGSCALLLENTNVVKSGNTMNIRVSPDHRQSTSFQIQIIFHASISVQDVHFYYLCSYVHTVRTK